MSSGVKHEAVAKPFLVIVGLAQAILVIAGMLSWRLAAIHWVGMYVGFFLITPDADLPRVTRAEARWFKGIRGRENIIKAFLRYHLGILALELGFWPGVLLKHRGISHTPIVGALVIAVLCLLSPLGIIILLSGKMGGVEPELVVCGLAGFVVAHLVHIIMDRIYL